MTWILNSLKKKTNINFYITEGVFRETISKALEIPRFKYEGMRVLRRVRDDTIQVYSSSSISNETREIMHHANKIYRAKGHTIKIIHRGEAETIALARKLGTPYIGIDEKTTRLLIEDHFKLGKILESKLHTHIVINEEHLEFFKRNYGNLTVFRSSELVIAAYQKGILLPVTNAKELIEAALWGVKSSGCAISVRELNEYVSLI